MGDQRHTDCGAPDCPKSEAGVRAAALCEHSRSHFRVGSHFLGQTHIRLPQRGIARQARTGHTRVQ
jgi:hypothetical protein